MAVGSRPRRGKCTDPPQNHTLQYRQGQGGSARPSGTAVKHDKNRKLGTKTIQTVKNQLPTNHRPNTHQIAINYQEDGHCAHASRAQPHLQPMTDPFSINYQSYINQKFTTYRSIINQLSRRRALRPRRPRPTPGEKRCTIAQKRNSAGTEKTRDAPQLKNEIALARKGKAVHHGSKATAPAREGKAMRHGSQTK